jgi:hypothetical protein
MFIETYHDMKYHVTKYIYIFNMKFEKKCKCTSNISKAKANWMKLCMNSSLDFNKKKFKCLINFISDYHKKILMSFSYKLAYSLNFIFFKNLMLHKKCQKFMKFEELNPRQHYKLECNNLKFWCETLYLHFGHDFWLFSDIYSKKNWIWWQE